MTLKAYQMVWDGTARFYCADNRKRAARLAADDIDRVCDIGVHYIMSNMKCMRAPLLDDQAEEQGHEGIMLQRRVGES